MLVCQVKVSSALGSGVSVSSEDLVKVSSALGRGVSSALGRGVSSVAL